MFISFDVKQFAGNPKGLTNTLYNLRRSNISFDATHQDIIDIACRTPSAAYRYTRFVAPFGLGSKAERVFLKNPNIGLKYLKFLRKKEFADQDTQKRFWRKITKNPWLSFDYANMFGVRLSETEEKVFVESMRCAKDYAFFVIKGRFPEEIHNMLILKSFEKLPAYELKSLKEYISYADNQKS